MNKNEQTAIMYETIPAVAELNKVPGFNPMRLLRRISSPENGEEMMQLDLRYKKLWFRLANPKGRIRLNALRITEQMAIYEAQIFLERTDENPIGSFTSSCSKEEAPGGQYIQAAQQAAMDEALSDAGFGIQFADVGIGGDGRRYGSRVPLDGGQQSQKAAAPSAAGTVSTERPQQTAAPVGSTVKTFPMIAGKTGISRQGKPAQASGMPVQGRQEAAAVKAEEKRPEGHSLAQNTDTKVLPAAMAGKETPAVNLPAGSPGGAESLPANPENSFESLPVPPAAETNVEQTVTAQEEAGNDRLPAGTQEKMQAAGTGELPVKAPEPESLPVQADTGVPAAEKSGNSLPVSERKNAQEDTRTAVQGMMALLGGQNVSEKTATLSGGDTGSVENMEAERTGSGSQALPATGEPAQEKTNARYTPDMPVEEIVSLMTLEEAGKVVVDTGVCKGQTIAEVAERRPPSLKFYLYGGYRGDNNILRAAAQIMLDSLAVKKAG